MSKEGLKYFLDIPQVVDIIKKWSLIINMDINKMLNMSWRNYIGVDVVNKIPIREDGRNKID